MGYQQQTSRLEWENSHATVQQLPDVLKPFRGLAVQRPRTQIVDALCSANDI